ncbi:hypothetical protein C0Q70_18659 [Pomacea canaliculata]|uniref:Uncharacterized protein n=1 Tax=Pomacea canaliculata TaxID=400727 RepID=A0A2T7NH44_POMCA|nr:hypothetical protein C0Q70_18659 [Pomacea canaliculata]
MQVPRVCPPGELQRTRGRAAQRLVEEQGARGVRRLSDSIHHTQARGRRELQPGAECDEVLRWRFLKATEPTANRYPVPKNDKRPGKLLASLGQTGLSCVDKVSHSPAPPVPVAACLDTGYLCDHVNRQVQTLEENCVHDTSLEYSVVPYISKFSQMPRILIICQYPDYQHQTTPSSCLRSCVFFVHPYKATRAELLDWHSTAGLLFEEAVALVNVDRIFPGLHENESDFHATVEYPETTVEYPETIPEAVNNPAVTGLPSTNCSSKSKTFFRCGSQPVKFSRQALVFVDF